MKRFGIFFVILLVGIGAMLNSCIEETDVDFISEGSPILRFRVSSAAVDTRVGEVDQDDSLEQADSVCWSVMEVEGDEEFTESLYVTMVTEQREPVTGDECASEDMNTRGEPVTTETFASMYGKRGFGLFAYVYKPGTWDENSITSEYIHNKPVQFTSSSYWALTGHSTEQYYWPGSNYNVRFYAYAPIDGGEDGFYNEIIKVQSSAYVGIPKIDVSVSSVNLAASSEEKMSTHPDLVIAKSDEVPGNKNAEQPLTFKHAMSAITFKVGAMFVDGTIKKIEFRNVLRSGRLNLESQTWEDIDTDNPATISLTKDIPIKKDATGLVLEEKDYFMMLPQELPSNATLAITFVQSDNGKEHTLVSPIGKQNIKWEMGCLYTFTLTATQSVKDDYIFEVTAPSTTTANYLGNKSTGEGTVKSYCTHTNAFGIQTKEAIKWTTEYSTDGGSTWTTTRPEFFSSFTAGANGKIEGTDTYKGTIAPITPDDPKNPFGATVDKRPVSTTTINLADPDNDGKHTTANCYVVNKAGTYTFPVVYGNAIKNGTDNVSAYNPGGSGADKTDYYATFVDHSGAKISSPYIYPKKLNAAKLLWTDAPNLIRDVELSTTSETMSVVGTNVRYITFTVPKEHLAPGNAVIAILDPAGVIMWSWHIWVTTWSGTSVSVNSNSKTFNFSNTILGYCPARDAKWNDRDVMVRFKQTGSGKVSSTYTFEQDGFDLQYSEGNMPYYQWGRKDPLLMYNYITNSTTGTATSGAEKICFGTEIKTATLKVWGGSSYVNFPYSGYFEIEGKVGTGRDNGVTMSESIQNPCTFYPRSKTASSTGGYEFDWCTHIGWNRWDATNKNYVGTDYVLADVGAGATVKTIYDPCPPGWCVPPVGAFYGLTSYGNASAVNPSKTSMSEKDNTPAFQLKANGGKTVKLPITGDRNRYFGSPWYTDLISRCVELWTSTPSAYKHTSSHDLSNGTSYTSAYYAISGEARFYAIESNRMAKSSGLAVLPVKEEE